VVQTRETRATDFVSPWELTIGLVLVVVSPFIPINDLIREGFFSLGLLFVADAFRNTIRGKNLARKYEKESEKITRVIEDSFKTETRC
jgi:hypothetical protein